MLSEPIPTYDLWAPNMGLVIEGPLQASMLSEPIPTDGLLIWVIMGLPQVSVLIFLVPSYAVALETPLFGKVGIVLIKLRECCPNFKPPKPLDGAGLVPPPAASSSSVAGSASNLHA